MRSRSPVEMDVEQGRWRNRGVSLELKLWMNRACNQGEGEAEHAMQSER